MINITNIDGTTFEINGIRYYKNFISLVAGNSIRIIDIYDADLVLVPFTNYTEFTVNGNTFANVADLQQALLPVLFTRESLNGLVIDGNIVDVELVGDTLTFILSDMSTINIVLPYVRSVSGTAVNDADPRNVIIDKYANITTTFALDLTGATLSDSLIDVAVTAINNNSPFSINDGEQAVFFFDVVRGAYIDRYYFREKSGVSTINNVDSSDIIADGKTTFVLSAFEIDLGDIGVSNIEDGFNSNPTEPFTISGETFIRATQNTVEKVWYWNGGDGQFGNSGSNGPASASDFILLENDFITNNNVLVPQGNWDSDTNTPDITGTTETGYFWIVSVAGNTNLGGITDWQVNDWAVKTVTGWAKVDNTDTLEGYTESGTRSGGDLNVIIGDYDDSGNGTKFRVVQTGSQIVCFSESFQMNGLASGNINFDPFFGFIIPNNITNALIDGAGSGKVLVTREWVNEQFTNYDVSWGDIIGTLSNQTDLQNALDAKADLSGDNLAFTNIDNNFSTDQTVNGRFEVRNNIAGWGFHIEVAPTLNGQWGMVLDMGSLDFVTNNNGNYNFYDYLSNLLFQIGIGDNAILNKNLLLNGTGTFSIGNIINNDRVEFNTNTYTFYNSSNALSNISALGFSGSGANITGVDAETLDGLDSSDFVRRTGAIDEEITGNKTFVAETNFRDVAFIEANGAFSDEKLWGVSNALGPLIIGTYTDAGILTEAAILITRSGTSINGISFGADINVAGTIAGSVKFEYDTTQTGTTYTIVSTDTGKVIPFNNSSAITVTVNNTSLTDVDEIVYLDVIGTGELTVSAGAGVTLQVNANRQAKSDGQFSRIAIHKVGTSTYRVFGELQSV